MSDYAWVAFCGEGIDWGDVGGWLSALATFAAVVVALMLPSQQRKHDADLLAKDQAQKQELAASLFYDVMVTVVINASNVAIDSDDYTENRFDAVDEQATKFRYLADLPTKTAVQVAQSYSLMRTANRICGMYSSDFKAPLPNNSLNEMRLNAERELARKIFLNVGLDAYEVSLELSKFFSVDPEDFENMKEVNRRLVEAKDAALPEQV